MNETNEPGAWLALVLFFLTFDCICGWSCEYIFMNGCDRALGRRIPSVAFQVGFHDNWLRGNAWAQKCMDCKLHTV